MYTQCPECQTAFRVTARVLQQAGGRVRCGGCGSAFNALDSLSEELPAIPEETPVPESAADDAQSKKLLETLNQLAGPENVVIEDTGVEWQVLEEPSDDDPTGQHDLSDTGTMRWMIEDDEADAVPEIVDEVPLASAGDDDSVMRFDDNTPLPEDFDDIVTTSPSTPLRRQEDRVELETRHFDDMQIDLALGEPDEWVDLLDEVDEGADPAVSIEVEEELAAIHSELSSHPAGKGRRTPPAAKRSTPPDAGEPIDSQEEVIPPAASGSPAAMLDAVGDDDDSIDEELPDDDDDSIDEELHDDDESELTAAGEPDLESTGEFEEQIEMARRALSGEVPAETADESADDEIDLSLVDESPDELDAQIVAEDEDDDAVAERVLRGEIQAADVTPADDATEIPEQAAATASARTSRYPEHLFDENSASVETIIMEGEFVHGSLQEQAQDAKNKAGNIDEAAFLADTYSISRNKIRGGRRRTDPPGAGTIAMAIVLLLVLAGQVIHASRETLSTIGAFNQTIAPLYRLLGSPIVPQWNIKGWQFQETRGSTDENGEILTIQSTIKNRSSQPLPYPLVHVSLTDRWEEIIGSRVLDPNEYLAGDLDPSRPVAPNEAFTAVISISSPAPEATGFKLNVCYRVGPGKVRCATEDFKD